ncbi:MAG TPA: DNA polymerase domain-containing protein [Anaerolineales bacterium]|nr:DNA polymerase domain-containing protein [Anaerolineales bacterium]
MSSCSGWLSDLYAHPEKGVVFWLLGDDQKPHCFFDRGFEIPFYAGGDVQRLRQLWRFLKSRKVKLQYTQREDLFAGLQDVVEARVPNPAGYPALFRQVERQFPELVFYDADIALPLRFMAARKVFMLAHCEVTAREDGQLVHIDTCDSPEELDPKLPSFRKLHLRPDLDPTSATPKRLLVKYDGFSIRAPLDRPRELLLLLRGILEDYDPDVILTHFGDTWLLAHLEQASQKTGISLDLNRDTSMPVLRRKEVSFFNYGRAHYRGQQVHLRGRWHIDYRNGMTFTDYGLTGAIEETRMTGLPVQEAARRSPGAGIAALQTITAMRQGILIPYQHQKGELPKSYNQMVKSDRGGLILQPPVGVFPNVAILDFSSMMASIMIEFNVSPETAGMQDPQALELPELGLKIGVRPGLMPAALRPLRDKRLKLKRLLKTLEPQDARHRSMRRRYKAVVDALKWLTVVAYGRLGFANSTFGRINAHEVVSFLSRKVITRAKLTAEDRGFHVLHLYVDSLFVSRPGASPADFQDLAKAIEQETHLPIELQKIYPWFAFLGTRENANISVANRFYGLSPEGDHKIRGIALRRSDTPRFISNLQMDLLNILAREPDPDKLVDLLPQVLGRIQEKLAALKAGQVPLDELVVAQTLSRELNEYSYFSHAATAAKQLEATGKTLRMGQRVRYLHIAAGPGARAWDLADDLDPRSVDMPRYRELLLRAVHEVMQPLGVSEPVLRAWLFSRAGYVAPPGIVSSPTDLRRIHLPLFSSAPRAGLPALT